MLKTYSCHLKISENMSEFRWQNIKHFNPGKNVVRDFFIW